MKNHKLSETQEKQVVRLYLARKPDGSFYTQKQIGEKFKVCVHTISRCLNKFGVSCAKRQGDNNRKLTKEQTEQIVADYTTPLSDGSWMGSPSIAHKYGVAPPTIRYILRRQGITIRTSSQAISGKACKPITRLPPEGESPPLCKCGCGQPVEWFRAKNRWYVYVKGHYRPRKPYHDKAWLQCEYAVKARTMAQIAQDFDVAETTIRKALKKADVPIRSQADSLRLSGAVRGPNNPAWKGGVAKWSYSHDWKFLSRRIKQRDSWTCQLCGEHRKHWGHSLHVHHIDTDKTNNHPHNLIALCAKCHRPIHNDKKIRKLLSSIAQRNTELAS